MNAHHVFDGAGGRLCKPATVKVSDCSGDLEADDAVGTGYTAQVTVLPQSM